MNTTMQEKKDAFERLLNIMDELREKCPWDKKQTFESLRSLTIEETYELADGILKHDLNEIKKEIEKVKSEGLALANEEYKLGLLSFAAPIFNGTNRIIAATGIVAPVAQFNEAGLKQLKIDLKSCTAEISQVIGRTS